MHKISKYSKRIHQNFSPSIKFCQKRIKNQKKNAVILQNRSKRQNRKPEVFCAMRICAVSSKKTHETEKGSRAFLKNLESVKKTGYLTSARNFTAPFSFG